MQELISKEDVTKYKPEYVTALKDAGIFGLSSLGCTIHIYKDKVYKTILDVPAGTHIGLYNGNNKSEAFGYLADRFRISYKNEIKLCKP